MLFVNEAKKVHQKEFIRWFTLAASVNPLLKFFRNTETKIPTLYVMGAEDHMFLPSIKKLVKAHKTTRLTVIPNCGHVVNVDQAQIFNQESIQFISSL